MANKKIFSYGNNGKRKIGHSKFDMGHEHIMSANFGGLHTAACFETLPDDYWDISDNTVTLLKPLTAPAFARINQNFYGAYVRNQQIWKYWNDYISNGTAFGDTYGNNVTNQSLQNAWDVPSIPVPYLQTILKIGYGNATPVWHLEYSLTSSSPQSNLQTIVAFLVDNVKFFNVAANTVYRVTDLFYLLLQVDPLNSSLKHRQVAIVLRDIDFTHYAFDCWIYKDSNGNYHMLFSLYCSLRQYLVFQRCFPNTGIGPATDPSTIGKNVSDVYSPQTEHFFAWRFFADRCSSDPSTSQSAFVIEKSLYQIFDTDNALVTVKSLDYFPRVIDSDVQRIYKEPFINSNFSQEVWQSIHSPYWGMRYCFNYYDNSSSGYFLIFPANYPSLSISSDFYWQLNAADLFGNTSDFKSLMESWSSNISYLGVSTSNFPDALDTSRYASGLNLLVTADSTNHRYFPSNNFGFGVTISNIFTYFTVSAACDFTIALSTFQNVSDYVPLDSFSTRESQALGFDGTSMVAYLCNNSCTLLDEFGIKVDPLSQRPFTDYRFELINALPFFAYSKIWQDNFRNPVVSSPELDYSESNSLIFAPINSWYRDFVFNSNFIEPAVRPARYVGKTYTDFRANGWTLELTTFPRNSQGSAIHTHLPIKSFNDVFTILTGSNFDGLFAKLQSTELNVFDTYLPTYYNGLLHMKYQNFNKDYFTSALLDPMSGANQVSVGSTINELRQAEAEQHWWERTAMYRSIKSWFEGTYGITPIELPDDSRITGTDHINVNIGEVIQTSGSTPESPQGTRSGLGGCRGSGTLCHGHANEHGWIIILVSHTVESQYLQNYDKMFDVKESFLDYPTIDFAGLGNESILQKEVNYSTPPTKFFDQSSYSQATVDNYLPSYFRASRYYNGQTNPIRLQSLVYGRSNIADSAGTSLDNVFGFIPRYSSYKFKFDKVSGQFRHELAFWHTFKRYYSSPILCHEFVNWEMAADDDEINRIFAVSDDFLDDKFAIDCFINAHVDRALPFVCVPMSK